MLIGLPVLLGLVWWSGEAKGRAATADVTIDTAKVVEVRTSVIDRLTELGATKASEDTAYTDGGDSELTFRVPPAKLEAALRELNLVGAVVTRQRVEVDDVTADANSIADRLSGVSGCLDSLSNGNAADDAAGIATCRQRLEAAAKQVEESPQAARDAVLQVHITRTSTTSPALIVAVVLLAIALATMAYLTIRSARSDVYDITDRRPTRATEDLYHRRN
jgi:hypothetical protein